VVEMLPRAAEGLPQPRCFVLQPFGQWAFEPAKQLLIEIVAVCGNVRQQGTKRSRRVVRVGAAAVGARGHQYRTGQHRGGFEQQFLARNRPRFHALHQASSYLLTMKRRTPRCRCGSIPLAEVIVRPLVHRMAKSGPGRANCRGRRVEPGPASRFGSVRAENFERLFDQRLVAASATPLGVERTGRTHSCSRARFFVRFEHGYGR
jgi:hypothetical protein